MDQTQKHQLALLLIITLIGAATSATAAPRSDITIVLSEDLQSYLYKESVTCEKTTCLYQNSFAQKPLWIIDNNGKSLQLGNEVYRLENTSISVMYKSATKITDKTPSQVTLSFPLSHLSNHNNVQAAYKQRSVLVVPETVTIVQYNTPATNPNWQKFDNLLKLETSSTSDLHFDILIKKTIGVSIATPDNQQAISPSIVNTIPNTTIENTSIECVNVIDLIAKTECDKIGPMVLKRLTFNRNSASLSPSARAILDQLTQPLIDNNSGRFEIGAYTDSKGPKRWNLTLSKKRAQTIRQYLIFKGVNPNKLIAIGYGESNPTTSNNSVQGRNENRRIELKRHLEE